MALRQTLSAAPALASRRRAFPGEDESYSKARKSLLAEEIDLRRKIARVAEQRRALPPGPLMPREYRFRRGDGIDATLLDLFGTHETLVTYFWVDGAQPGRPCPMCVNWLGAVNGNGDDIGQHAALKIIGRAPVERQVAFAKDRGWSQLEFIQAIDDDFVHDFGLRNADGSDNAALMVFRRHGDAIRLFWRSEMTREMADPGQEPRDAPDVASLWHILDLTPRGRPTGWRPQLDYRRPGETTEADGTGEPSEGLDALVSAGK